MRTNKLFELAKPYLEKNDFGVEHTKRVLEIARTHFMIPKELEEFVVALIILHDIGGSTVKEQYQEGPKIATDLLKQLCYTDDFIENVCEIIRTHHERLKNPSDTFKILYDADQLAKFSPEEFQYYKSKSINWDSIINQMYFNHSKILAKKEPQKRQQQIISKLFR